MCSIGKKALILLLGLTCHSGNAFTNPTTFTPRSVTTTQLSVKLADDDDYSISFESAVRNGWKPERGQFSGIRRKASALEMNEDGAVMPDGGLSPCIIKVVGVGGGGCNAVSTEQNHSIVKYRLSFRNVPGALAICELYDCILSPHLVTSFCLSSG